MGHRVFVSAFFVLSLVALNLSAYSVKESKAIAEIRAVTEKADDRGDSLGQGTFSQGARFGELYKASWKSGWFTPNSCEGQVMLGVEGKPFERPDGDKVKVLSPWHFSTSSKEFCDWLIQHSGDYMTFYYYQSQVKSVQLETDYALVDTLPLEQARQEFTAKGIPDTYSLSEDQIEALGMKSEGVRTGIISKMSYKGTLTGTFEVIVQLGDGGGGYWEASVSDVGLFDYMFETMKIGRKVRLYYRESFVNVSARDTKYLIYKVEKAVNTVDTDF